MIYFKDREEAGELLAEKIEPQIKGCLSPVVLGIPRGGVVVAAQLAKAFKLPLDVTIVRKLGVPGHEEVAFGAVDLHGRVYLEPSLVGRLSLPPDEVEELRREEWQEAKRREAFCRQAGPAIALVGREIILVDDGVATGATTLAAAACLRDEGVKKIILAVPVAPHDSLNRLAAAFDDLVVLAAPLNFMAVGQFYEYFPQVTDDEVLRLIAASRKEAS